ncbi:MAG: NADH-quinone oxidoreductase subunit M [Flavobacteriales bacterium]|nr:NADH-quinone oxidoreductase subunit M [Flavobacteriales bacterium]
MILILIPLIAALINLVFKDKMSRVFAVSVSVLQLIYTGFILSGFDKKASGFQNSEFYEWYAQLGLNFSFAIDGISMVLILLTNIGGLLILISSLGNHYPNTARLNSLILLMLAALNGVFLSTNGLLFYVFWELALIPIYFIVGIWGGENRIKITFKFFIYTFLGSLLMLIALIFVYLNTPGAHSFEWSEMIKANLSPGESALVLWSFFIAFAIKMPVFPFHTWQPDTYSVAPSQGTMLLSGIMLKMGVFGMIRWMYPISANACNCNYYVFMVFAIVSIVYAAIIAIMQNDIKRVIAWSSISHVGLIAAGVMTWKAEGVQGGILQMFTHGINIIGLFFIVEVIERRLHTRDLNQMGGLAKNARGFSVVYLIILLGSVAVPLTNGFPGEFLLLSATFKSNTIMGIVAGLTIIFCAVYMLRIYQFSMFGKEKENAVVIGRLTISEYLTLGLVVFFVILIGIFPGLILDISETSVNSLLNPAGGQVIP